MDNSEAMYWLAILQQANEGNKEAMELLRQENELRVENGLPMIQAELQEMVEESELIAKIEEIKKKKMMRRK